MDDISHQKDMQKGLTQFKETKNVTRYPLRFNSQAFPSAFEKADVLSSQKLVVQKACLHKTETRGKPYFWINWLWTNKQKKNYQQQLYGLCPQPQCPPCWKAPAFTITCHVNICATLSTKLFTWRWKRMKWVLDFSHKMSTNNLLRVMAVWYILFPPHLHSLFLALSLVYYDHESLKASRGRGGAVLMNAAPAVSTSDGHGQRLG